MPTLVACMRWLVEALQPRRVPTRFGPATRLCRPENQWNQGPLATPQAEMCPRTANSGLAAILALGAFPLPAHARGDGAGAAPSFPAGAGMGRGAMVPFGHAAA